MDSTPETLHKSGEYRQIEASFGTSEILPDRTDFTPPKASMQGNLRSIRGTEEIDCQE
jgi:hypothetical protein